MDLLHDRYRIERPLGSGGAGTTWLAIDQTTGDPVTVKRLSTPIGAGQQATLDRETRLLAQLDHPQIPTFIEAYTETYRMQDYLHLVLAYVEGEPLDVWMAGHRHEQDEARVLVDELLTVVAWLHRLAPPVLHRDIKPSNVIRRPDGGLSLIDFGLATDAVDKTFMHTMAVGTLGYQAPEQIAGDPRPASDVYGVGVLALELLTRASPRELLSGQTLEWRGRAAHLEPRWQRWLQGALDPDVEKRYADAGVALAALRDTDERVTVPAPSSVPTPATRPPAQGLPSVPKQRAPTVRTSSPIVNGTALRLGLMAGGMLLVIVLAVGFVKLAGGPMEVEPPAQVEVPWERPAAVAKVEADGPGVNTASACRLGDDDACMVVAEQLGTPDASGSVPQSNQRLRAELLGLVCSRRPGLAEACVARAELEGDEPSALTWWVEACVRDAPVGCERVLAVVRPQEAAAKEVRSRLEKDCAGLARQPDVRVLQASCGLLHGWTLMGIGGAVDVERATALAEEVCPGVDGVVCLPADLEVFAL